MRCNVLPEDASSDRDTSDEESAASDYEMELSDSDEQDDFHALSNMRYV